MLAERVQGVHDQKVTELGDSELTSSLGVTREVELPAGYAAHEVALTLEKGTISDGSFSNASAVYDLINELQLESPDGQIVTLPGDTIRYFNIIRDGEETNDGNGLGEFQIRLPAPLIPSKMDVAKVAIDVADITSISDGTSQSGTTIKVSAGVNQDGTYDVYRTFKARTVNFSGTGDQEHTQPLGGVLRGLVVHEDGGTVSSLTLEAVRSGAPDLELFDDDLDRLRQANRKRFGVTESLLPSGYYWIPLPAPVDFRQEDVNHLHYEFTVDQTGDIELIPILENEPSNEVSA